MGIVLLGDGKNYGICMQEVTGALQKNRVMKLIHPPENIGGVKANRIVGYAGEVPVVIDGIGVITVMVGEPRIAYGFLVLVFCTGQEGSTEAQTKQ